MLKDGKPDTRPRSTKVFVDDFGMRTGDWRSECTEHNASVVRGGGIPKKTLAATSDPSALLARNTAP